MQPPAGENDDGVSQKLCRGDRTAIELFRQGVSNLSLQLAIASTALLAILAG